MAQAVRGRMADSITMRSRVRGLLRLSGRALRVRAVCCGAVAAGLTAAMLPAVTGGLPGGPAVMALADDVTASLDNLRTGWDPSEPGLSPATVSGGSFGQIFSTAVNGQVYAQPLVVGSTVIVATENDWVYGLNAATGAVEWSDSLGTPYAITFCGDLTPNIGVTSAPVYDPASGSVYLVAQTVPATYPTYRLFGINAQTGTITLNRQIGGRPTNDPNIKFSAKYENARPGLLLMNGWVYAAFASHCDRKPYVGYVAGVNISTGARTLWTDESGVTNDQGGIWQSGGGLMSDGPGRVFFASGNGVSPPPGPGTSPPGQLAESTVRLAVQSNGSLAAQDFFSPANAATLDASDTDFGSGGPVGLPFGTSTYPDLLVQAGKDGRIILLNRDNLGGQAQGTGGTDAAVAMLGPYAGEWAHPGVFGDTTTLTPGGALAANDYLYYVGRNDYLRMIKVGDDGTDTPTLSDVANSSLTFGFSSGSPVITSNGTDPSSAVLWEVRASGGTGSYGRLYAFGAVPPPTCTAAAPCTMAPIWSGPIGTASKFTIPATSNGMVYVGTRDGHVLGFGVKTTAPILGAEPATFPQTTVGSATTKDVTVTAATDVTVAGVSAGPAPAPAPFTVGPVTETVNGVSRGQVTFPVTLHPGDRLSAQVSFLPAAPGGATGTLSFATDSASSPSVDVPLYGDGVRTGLYASSPILPFQLVLDDGLTVTNVPVGISVPLVADIVNGGAAPEAVTSVIAPARPFTATGLPKPGTVIQPGESIPVKITFAPKLAVPYASSFTVAGSSGFSATVSLSGTGLAAVSKFTAAPGSVNFGRVPLSHTVRAWIRIANAGNQSAMMSGSSPLAAPFGAPYPVARKLRVNAGDDLTIPVTFTPTRNGTVSGAYRLTWTDQTGAHTISVRLTGTGV